MTDQSRLEIVIDSSGAEQNVRNVRAELEELESRSAAAARANDEAASSFDQAGSSAGSYGQAAEQAARANDDFASGADTARQSTRQLAGESESATTSINGLRVAALSVVGALSAMGATSFFRSLIDEQEQLERNLLRTEAVVRATGQAAGFSAQQLMEQARGMAGATLGSTEEIMRAQQVMLTFRSVTNDTFTEAMGLAQDLATVTGGSLTGSVQQLGRALEDPVQGINALRRSGVSFTNAQRDMIQRLVETGDVLGAQRVILDELAQQYGGVARQEAEGLAGAQDTLAQATQEARIALADYFALGERANSFYNVLSDGVNRFSGALTSGNLDGRIRLAADAMQILAGVAAGRLVGSLGATAGAKLTAVAAAVRYQAALASMAGVSRTAAAGQIALAGATRTAAAALALVGGPAGAAVLAGAALWIYRDRLTGVAQAARITEQAVNDLTAGIDANNEAALDGALIQYNAQLFDLERQAREAREQIERLQGASRTGGALGLDAGQTGAQVRAQQELATITTQQAAVREAMSQVEAMREGLNRSADSGDEAADALDRLGNTADGLVAKFRPMLTDDIESVLERAGPGARIDDQGMLRDAWGNTLPTLQRELDAQLQDQIRAFESEQNLMRGLEAAAAAFTEKASEAVTQAWSNAPGLLPTAEQDGAPALAQPRNIGSLTFKLEGPNGGRETEVEGDADDLRRLADLFSGVAAAV